MLNRVMRHRHVSSVRLRHLLRAMLLSVLPALFLLALSGAEESVRPPEPSETSCESAEQCFRSALAPDVAAVSADERVARKLERLRRFTEQYAGSIWARRANLVIGVLLIERQPA